MLVFPGKNNFPHKSERECVKKIWKITRRAKKEVKKFLVEWIWQLTKNFVSLSPFLDWWVKKSFDDRLLGLDSLKNVRISRKQCALVNFTRGFSSRIVFCFLLLYRDRDRGLKNLLWVWCHQWRIFYDSSPKFKYAKIMAFCKQGGIQAESKNVLAKLYFYLLPKRAFLNWVQNPIWKLYNHFLYDFT